MNFIDTFVLICGIQTFIITLIFFFYKSEKFKINRYLGFFFLTLLIEIILEFLDEEIKATAFVYNPLRFNFLTSILLFFYVVEISGIEIKKRYRFYLPAILEFAVFSIIFVVMLIDFKKIPEQALENFYFIYGALASIFNTIVCIVIFRMTLLHKKLLPKFYINVKYKSLDWIALLCLFCIFYNVFMMTNKFFIHETKVLPDIGLVLYIALLYYIGISSLVQINIVNYIVVDSVPYSLKGFDNNEKEFVKALEKIEECMKGDKLYLNSNVSIGELSKKIEISKNLISKSLKMAGHKNFNTYINTYRVDKVKTLFLKGDYKKYTIVAIARQAGFNSRASFYMNFKKVVGLSPSDFIENIKSGGKQIV